MVWCGTVWHEAWCGDARHGKKRLVKGKGAAVVCMWYAWSCLAVARVVVCVHWQWAH